MNLEAERRLKFDRRLRRRVGWVSDTEMAAELDALPDSADKAESQDASEAPAEPGSAAHPPTDAGAS